MFYIVEIADTGSFSQAARNLYVSQPNLSHAVRQVESEIGCSLFIRTPSGVVPTSEGQTLIEHFRVMKQEYDYVRQLICGTAKAPQLSLRIASLDFGRANRIYSDLIKRYIGSPIKFSFLHYSKMEELLPLVETCQVDFAIIGTLSPFVKTLTTRLQNQSIEYHKMADVPICAIVGPENPLFNGPDIQPLSALYPFTIIQNGNAADEPSRSLPHVTGLSTHCFGEIHVNTSQLFYDTIADTSAIGLIAYTPHSFQHQRRNAELRVIRLSDCDITAEFGWIKQRRLPLTDIASDLLSQITGLF